MVGDKGLEPLTPSV